MRAKAVIAALSESANPALNDHGPTERRSAAALPAPKTFAGARRFPLVATPPALPPRIQDEKLEYFSWLFCQGGFRNLNMTFEQFLTTIAVIQPAALCSDRDG
jgi:hypothetical protein